MTKFTPSTYRVAEIEQEARRLRAEMMTNALRRALAWARMPRQLRPQQRARTA